VNAAGLGAIGLTGVALYCAVRAALAVPADILGSLAAPAVAVACCAVALVAMTVAGGRAMRTYRYRIDPGGAPEAAIEHEFRHVDKGAQFGGSCTEGRVYANGSGYVDVRLPRGAPVEHHVAVDMAGARGEGENFWTSPHARGDRANAAARVAHLSADERDRVYREAEQLAAPRWWPSGSASAVRRALQRTGSYR
jgi:hypothetical protein